jgi:ATP-dependent exoDNAse (exonuclease V) beta subunit
MTDLYHSRTEPKNDHKAHLPRKLAVHPTLDFTLTFDPAAHSYTDNHNTPYVSVTTLVKAFFPPFDANAAAGRVAAREGRLEMEILTEWNRKRDASATYGTNVHAYAEALVQDWTRPAPATEREQRAFGIVDRALDMLSEVYDFLAAEQIIFDPLFSVAGTVDLLARNRTTGALAILDWKTCEAITNEAYNRALTPIAYCADSKIEHYTLQLSTYALMLADAEYSAYPYRGEPIEMALIHISPTDDDPVWIPLPYKRAEVVAMIESPRRMECVAKLAAHDAPQRDEGLTHAGTRGEGVCAASGQGGKGKGVI